MTRNNRGKELHPITGGITAETNDAWLLVVDPFVNPIRKAWLPKSCCKLEHDAIIFGSRSATISIPVWLIEKQQLENYVDD